MSRSDDTTADYRRATGTENRAALNMLRRLVVKVTSGTFWQMVGMILLDQVTKETPQAEVFSGVGFYARPAPGANAEAIVGAIGGAENPVIIATRDEGLRKKMAQLDQNETAIYNSLATVVIKKTGIVEIRLGAGVAQSTILGQTYRAAEDVLLTIISALAAQLALAHAPAGPSPHPGSAAAAAAVIAAVTAFQAAAASYLTTVAKVQ